MTDYLVSPLECFNSLTYCNHRLCWRPDHDPPHHALFPHKAHMGWILSCIQIKWVKCLPAGKQNGCLKNVIQMELWHQTQYGEGQDSRLEGLVGTLARSALDHKESQRSVVVLINDSCAGGRSGCVLCWQIGFHTKTLSTSFTPSGLWVLSSCQKRQKNNFCSLATAVKV